MRILPRLGFSFLLMLVFAAGIGLAGFLAVIRIKGDFQEVAVETMPVYSALEELKFEGLHAVSYVDEAAFAFLGARVAEGGINERAIQLLGELGPELQENRVRLAEVLSKYRRHVELYFPDEKDHLAEISGAAEKLQELAAAVLALKDRPYSDQELWDKTAALERQEVLFLRHVQKALQHEETELSERLTAVRTATHSAFRIIALISGLTLALVGLLGYSVSRSIAGPLKKIREATYRIARSEFSAAVSVASNDEIAELAADINAMSASLKRSESRLKESLAVLQQREEQYRTIVDNVEVGIYRNTLDGRFLQVNPAMVRIFGFDSVEQLLARSTAEVYEDPADRDGYLEEVRRSGLVRGRELRCRKRHGSPILISITTKAHYNEAGEIDWLDGVLEDITQRKAAEQELLAAKRQAEAANQAKSALVAMVSHEIRNSLNALTGFASLLGATSLDETQKDYLSVVLEKGASLLAVTNDILDLSKIEKGSLRLESVEFDLPALIEREVAAVKPRADQGRVAVKWVFAEDLPRRYLGDPTRVAQIVSNLLGNAVKFTSQGEITLSVAEDAPSRPPRRCIKISVRDTGIGISADRLSLVFEPFAQADPSIVRKFGGTGLGLSIVKALAEKMGGGAEVLSQVGVGSTFTIAINLEEVERAGV